MHACMQDSPSSVPPMHACMHSVLSAPHAVRTLRAVHFRIAIVRGNNCTDDQHPESCHSGCLFQSVRSLKVTVRMYIDGEDCTNVTSAVAQYSFQNITVSEPACCCNVHSTCSTSFWFDELFPYSTSAPLCSIVPPPLCSFSTPPPPFVPS